MRISSAGLLMALLLAACGPIGDPRAQTSGTDADATPTTQQEVIDTSSDDQLDFGDVENTAIVIIGGERYEFTDLYCVTMGGALGAVSVGGDPKVDIDIPPRDWETSGEDWGPPTIRVSGNEPYFDFRAGDEMFESDDRVGEGMSKVDSFTTDGVRATGTATFIDTNAVMLNQEPDPIEGTFEVTCGS
jgi:hypothetical protein